MARGRPTKYTPELAEKICSAVAINPCSLDEIISSNPEFPTRQTIQLWRRQNDNFFSMYAKAKQFQADILAEGLIELSRQKSYYHDEQGNSRVDTGDVASTRLQVDTIKWLASKLVPKVYGEKGLIDELKAENDKYKQELEELRTKLDERNRREY